MRTGAVPRGIRPTKLFNRPYENRNELSTVQTYHVSPDGKRFLMIKQGTGRDQVPPTIEVARTGSRS